MRDWLQILPLNRSPLPLALNGPAAILGIAALLLVALALVVLAIVRMVRNLSLQMQQSLLGQMLNGVKREIDSGEYARSLQAPVSLAGMERIYGPQIQADFPELNLDELKRRAERLVYATLEAISASDPTRPATDWPSGFDDGGPLYRSQIRAYLDNLRSLGQRERYGGITIHRLALSDYRKEAGTCRIHFQLAVGAEYRKTDASGQTLAGGDGASQFRCDIEALYVQKDSEKNARAVNCPNCGAPVPTLGDRTCSYCGSAIEPNSRRVWHFSDFRRIDQGS